MMRHEMKMKLKGKLAYENQVINDNEDQHNSSQSTIQDYETISQQSVRVKSVKVLKNQNKI